MNPKWKQKGTDSPLMCLQSVKRKRRSRFDTAYTFFRYSVQQSAVDEVRESGENSEEHFFVSGYCSLLRGPTNDFWKVPVKFTEIVSLSNQYRSKRHKHKHEHIHTDRQYTNSAAQSTGSKLSMIFAFTFFILSWSYFIDLFPRGYSRRLQIMPKSGA